MSAIALAPRGSWYAGKRIYRGIPFDETRHAKPPDRVQQHHFGCCARVLEQGACLLDRMLPAAAPIADPRRHGRRIVQHQRQALSGVADRRFPGRVKASARLSPAPSASSSNNRRRVIAGASGPDRPRAHSTKDGTSTRGGGGLSRCRSRMTSATPASRA